MRVSSSVPPSRRVLAAIELHPGISTGELARMVPVKGAPKLARELAKQGLVACIGDRWSRRGGR